MQFALVLSLVFHLLIVILLTVGLPFLTPEPPEMVETPIVVDLVQISERTAAPPPAPKTKEPPKEQPKQEVKAPTPPKEEARPEPQKPEPPKEIVKPDPPKPQPTKEPPPPPPPPKEEPKPKEPPKPKEEPKEKTPEKAPEPPKKEDPPKPKEEPKKEEPKKAEPKPDPKKDQKKEEDDDPFKDLVKNVEKFRKQESAAPAPTQQPANPAQQAAVSGARILNAPVAAQATMSEQDAIRAQIEQNWLIDSGAKGLENMVVVLRVRINPDGTVVDVRVEPDSWARYNSDSAFRAVADGAIRAAYKSSPLRYPTSKYETFQTMVLSFRPQSRM